MNSIFERFFSRKPFAERFTHYSATKAYTNNLGEGLWYELGTHGVDVIACIGMLTDTRQMLMLS